MTVLLEDVLHHLVAKTCVPSAIGGQLSQMEDIAGSDPPGPNCMHVRPRAPDPFVARDQEERRIFEQAPVLRCLDLFARLSDARVFRDKPTLNRLALEVPHRSQGELAILALRAYREWTTKSENRALVAVYDWARQVAPKLYPAVLHTETTLGQAFAQDKEGGASAARRKAASLYADALLAMNEWVGIFNRRRMALV